MNFIRFIWVPNIIEYIITDYLSDFTIRKYKNCFKKIIKYNKNCILELHA